VFGAGPALAPDQKPSWNDCQQAKEPFSLRTKTSYLFVVDFFSLLTTGGLISVGHYILSIVNPNSLA
jgi:hypothetical protein